MSTGNAKAKHVIVSGGHSGIGHELTKRLIVDGHQVGLIVRNAERAEAIDGVDHVFVADLADQRQVRSVAADIVARWGVVDVVFNNAGVLLDDIYQSPQGNEMHFEVNTLSPYLLTTVLEPALRAAEQPVVINTVTDGLHKQKALKLDELIAPTKFRKLIGPYLQSKLALTILMADLNRSWADVRIASVTPGPNKTGMTAGSGMPGLLKPLRNLMFAEPSKGAGLLYDAAFSGALDGYVAKGKRKQLKFDLSAADKQQLLAHLQTSHN